MDEFKKAAYGAAGAVVASEFIGMRVLEAKVYRRRYWGLGGWERYWGWNFQDDRSTRQGGPTIKKTWVFAATIAELACEKGKSPWEFETDVDDIRKAAHYKGKTEPHAKVAYENAMESVKTHWLAITQIAKALVQNRHPKKGSRISGDDVRAWMHDYDNVSRTKHLHGDAPK